MGKNLWKKLQVPTDLEGHRYFKALNASELEVSGNDKHSEV